VKKQSRVAPASWRSEGEHGEGSYEPQGRQEMREVPQEELRHQGDEALRQESKAVAA
jgi:hypothetical protein